MDQKRELLRHTVASLAYRAARVLDGAPEDFAQFEGAGRQPVQILAHMSDLFDWALAIVSGQQAWKDSKPRPWDAEVRRFHEALEKFDAYLASAKPLQEKPEKLFQGPIADSLNHVGQLTMLRRLAGSPVKGENYHKADITTGRVGADQPAPRREF